LTDFDLDYRSRGKAGEHCRNREGLICIIHGGWRQLDINEQNCRRGIAIVSLNCSILAFVYFRARGGK
jgi:hypothetical protein